MILLPVKAFERGRFVVEQSDNRLAVFSLIAALDDGALAALADPDDADGDGISGRLNRVWDTARGGPAIGRFGWKLHSPRVAQFVRGAMGGELGITVPVDETARRRFFGEE